MVWACQISEDLVDLDSAPCNRSARFVQLLCRPWPGAALLQPGCDALLRRQFGLSLPSPPWPAELRGDFCFVASPSAAVRTHALLRAQKSQWCSKSTVIPRRQHASHLGFAISASRFALCHVTHNKFVALFEGSRAVDAPLPIFKIAVIAEFDQSCRLGRQVNCTNQRTKCLQMPLAKITWICNAKSGDFGRATIITKSSAPGTCGNVQGNKNHKLHFTHPPMCSQKHHHHHYS